jgi:hypothetical protein
VTAMSEVEQAEVEHVLDFKVEYIFKFMEGSCVNND